MNGNPVDIYYIPSTMVAEVWSGGVMVASESNVNASRFTNGSMFEIGGLKINDDESKSLKKLLCVKFSSH